MKQSEKLRISNKKITQKNLPLNLRMEIYKVALQMKQNGLTYKEISNILSPKYGIKIPEDTIYRWVKNRNRPDGVFNKFTLKPSPNLSYLIGVFLGDGCTRVEPKRYKYFVRLKVKDREFAEEFAKRCAKLMGRTKPYLVYSFYEL